MLVSLTAFSATDDRSLDEAQSILNQIKEKNKHNSGYVSLFSGIMQVTTPETQDPLLLNSNSMMPFIGIDADYRLWDEFGLYFKFTHAQNILFQYQNSPSTGLVSPNSSASYQEMIESGLRYRFILDQTSVKNYVELKLGLYIMQNNFAIFTNALQSNQAPSTYLKSLQGVAVGVERSIPATPQFDVKGALDIIGTTSSQNLNPAFSINPSGVGFQFRGEIFYNFQWLGTDARLGGGYTMGVFSNQFNNNGGVSSNGTGLNAHVQAYREILILLNLVI